MDSSPLGTSLSLGERLRYHTFAIIGIILIIVAIAFGAYYWLRPLSTLSPAIEFIGPATTAWYVLDGEKLLPVPAPAGAGTITGKSGEQAFAMLVLPPVFIANASNTPPIGQPQPIWTIMLTDANGSTRNLGLGRPLGFLPDGSLLALTPLGLSRVTEDGTAFQLVNAGGDGSTSPIGVASEDLSLIAFENQVTRAIDVYRFNPQTLVAERIGAAILQSANPSQVQAAPSKEESTEAWLTILGTTTLDRKPTAQEQSLFNDAIRFARARASTPFIPQAVALSSGRLFVQAASGATYAFAVSENVIGDAEALTVVTSSH